ncbi:hypothetical protein [Enterobacter hormaechei]|nr:hypothetical protein [Enterobacter hormaechei]
MLKQFPAQPAALVCGIDRDIKQRRLVQNDLRDGERSHRTVNVQAEI